MVTAPSLNCRFAPARLPLAITLLLAGAAQAHAADSAALGADTATLQAVTVTGTRGEKRTVVTSPAPIDVISHEQLQTVGKAGLQEVLARLLPSFNLPAMPGSGANGVIRAAGLRGLNADQTLVLVNGKRRHNSALLQSGSWTSSGSTPVDLDMIPISAIDHIEVLRDGASAQYGSDAIAGVINIILKEQDNGGQATAGFGRNYQRDGITRQQNADAGFALPNNGFLHLALDNKSQDMFTRSEDATIYYNNAANQAVGQGKQLLNLGYGNPDNKTLAFSYNAELPLNDETSLYSFSTYGWRHGSKYANFRQPSSIDSYAELYPNGFSPRSVVDEKDYQATFGGRSQWGDWASDLSTSYSRDDIELINDHTLNPSLGPTSPTSFRIGNQVFQQWTNNLDLTRPLEVGMAKPMQVSVGLEHRYEKWALEKGEADSYLDGGYVIPDGRYAGQLSDRSQGVQGVSAADAGEADRNIYAAYVDLGFYPTDKWYFAVAARHEHYDDSAGDTTTGKLTTRYEFTPQLAVRATVSTGFRAPSLAQSVYQQNTNLYQTVGNQFVNYSYRVISPDSPVAQALGAKSLKPETSLNYSLGLTYSPANNLNVTLDAYQIDIDDRIVQSGILTGSNVQALFAQYGLSGVTGAQFYTNAVDTRTRGLDFVSDYTQSYGALGKVRWSAGLNLNRTDIRSIDNNLNSGTTYQIFGHSAQKYLTDGQPHNKLILGADWNISAFDVTLRATRYGSVVQPGTTSAGDRSFGAKWITDLDVAYHVTDHLTLAAGGNNLFNVYPDKNGVVGDTGLGAYGYMSPFGFGGGYYYTRATYTF